MKNLILLFVLLVSFFAIDARAQVCAGSERVLAVRDPLYGDEWSFRVREYEREDARGALLVLPSILGETELERGLALGFCRAGLRTVIVNSVRPAPTEVDVVNWAETDMVLVRAQVAVAAVVDELPQELPVALLGISLGAIQGAYVAGVETRVRASVLVTGAGNMPGVLAFGQQRLVAQERANRMRILGLETAEDYAAELRRRLTVDPLSVAAALPAESALVYVAMNDVTVPAPYQLELATALPQAQVVRVSGDHNTVIGRVTAQESRAMLAHILRVFSRP